MLGFFVGNRPDFSQTMVTDHAIKRYWERVPSSNDLDGPQVEQVIRDRLNKATFIIAADWQNDPVWFYQHDEMTFVLSPENKTVITLFPAEWGFGEEIDAGIRQKLLKQVRDLHKQIDKATAESDKFRNACNDQIASIDERIDLLEAELTTLRDAKYALEAKRSLAVSERNLLEQQLKDTSAKLLMSKRYSIETLATVQTVANGKRK